MYRRNDDDKRTSDGPVDDRPILELDGDGFVVQFHQEPDVINQRKMGISNMFSQLSQGQKGNVSTRLILGSGQSLRMNTRESFT